MFYQKEPIYALIILTIGAGGFLYFKAKKYRGGSGEIFASGKKIDHEHNFLQDLITYEILQRSLNNPERSFPSDAKKQDDEKEEELDETKRKIIELLEQE